MADGSLSLLAGVAIVVLAIIGYGAFCDSPKRRKGQGGKRRSRSADDGKLDLDNLPDLQTFPYRTRFKFMSDYEKIFFDLLYESAALVGCRVCVKVRLGDIFWVPGDSTNQGKEFWKWFAPISSRHVDFLVLDPEDKMLFALELDDPTHDTKKGKQSDKFKDAVFSSAGFPLIRVREYLDPLAVDGLFIFATRIARQNAGKRPTEVIRVGGPNSQLSEADLLEFMS